MNTGHAPAIPARSSQMRMRMRPSARVHCCSELPATVFGASYAAAAVAMAHYKAADSKREQFRRYLEKSGVLDTLTKVLVALYEEPEKPNSALDFLKHHLGAAIPENPEIELLRLELAEMKEKYEAIVEENKILKAKLTQYEPPQEEKRAE